jgi:hypothetical protein
MALVSCPMVTDMTDMTDTTDPPTPPTQERAMAPQKGSQFTREDWRPSPKRGSYPRVRSWGGQKKAPAAFLEAAKVSGIGSGKLRLCLYCGNIAVREAEVCRIHGGAKVASQRRPYVKSATWLAWHDPNNPAAKPKAKSTTGTTKQDTVPDTPGGADTAGTGAGYPCSADTDGANSGTL